MFFPPRSEHQGRQERETPPHTEYSREREREFARATREMKFESFSICAHESLLTERLVKDTVVYAGLVLGLLSLLCVEKEIEREERISPIESARERTCVCVYNLGCALCRLESNDSQFRERLVSSYDSYSCLCVRVSHPVERHEREREADAYVCARERKRLTHVCVLEREYPGLLRARFPHLHRINAGLAQARSWSGLSLSISLLFSTVYPLSLSL